VAVARSFYECDETECPMSAKAGIVERAEEFVGWNGPLTEASGITRVELTGIDLFTGCWSGPPTGPGKLSTKERGEPLAELFNFTGTLTPKFKNGTTAGKPTHIEYGAGSGELFDKDVGAGKYTGSEVVLGYNEQETITVGT
jgi:hypothetical protein